jgi:type IV pilus assembly protein PilE
MKQRVRGFTLMELMAVLAIMAIISSIAYGSYQNSIRKTKRAEAKTALLELSQRLERCYTANGAYDGASCASIHDGTNLVAAVATTEKGNYGIAISNLAASTFTLTATANFTDPDCATFTVTHTGAKTATGTNSTKCW